MRPGERPAGFGIGSARRPEPRPERVLGRQRRAVGGEGVVRAVRRTGERQAGAGKAETRPAQAAASRAVKSARATATATPRSAIAASSASSQAASAPGSRSRRLRSRIAFP